MKFRPGKRQRLLLAYGLLAYALFLLVTLPASVALRALPPSLQAGLAYDNVRGSVWRGEMSALRFGQLAMGTLRWRVRPLALLRGRLAVSLVGHSPHGQWRADVGLAFAQTLYLEQVQAELDSRLLDPLTRPFLLQGRLQIPALSGRLQPATRLNLDGEIRWQDAAIGGVDDISLGAVEARLKPQQRGTRITLRNRNSPLALDGTISLTENGDYTARFNLSNRDRKRQDIDELLNLLGRPDARGRVEIVQRGRLPL